jgi:hypothetical protein
MWKLLLQKIIVGRKVFIKVCDPLRHRVEGHWCLLTIMSRMKVYLDTDEFRHSGSIVLRCIITHSTFIKDCMQVNILSTKIHHILFIDPDHDIESFVHLLTLLVLIPKRQYVRDYFPLLGTCQRTLLMNACNESNWVDSVLVKC